MHYTGVDPEGGVSGVATPPPMDFPTNWASEASPTLGCSIEISRDIYMYVYIYVGMSRMSN